MTATTSNESVNKWDTIERLARTLSIVAIPVVLAIGGWVIQQRIQNQAVSRDYVQLAVTILKEPETSKIDPDMRAWAVQLLNDNSPTRFTPKFTEQLKSGETQLPESFNISTASAPAPIVTLGETKEDASTWEAKAFNFLLNKDIADPHADIRIIEKKFALTQEKINNRYKAMFTVIQKIYNIDHDFYTYFQNKENHITIDNEKKETVISAIPTQQEVRRSYFLSYLKKTLRKNNISESLVTFTDDNNKRSHSASPIFSSRIEDDLLHIHVDKPGCINIHPNTVTDLSLNAQRGCCIALVNDFKHTITAALLYHMVNAMTEKDINEKEFYKLINLPLLLIIFQLHIQAIHVRTAEYFQGR